MSESRLTDTIENKYNDQLTFVSGQILAAALVIYKARDYAAHLSSGRLERVTLKDANVVTWDFSLYAASLGLASAAFCVIVVAVLYLALRAWGAIIWNEDGERRFSVKLHNDSSVVRKSCGSLYKAIFGMTLYLFFWLSLGTVLTLPYLWLVVKWQHVLQQLHFGDRALQLISLSSVAGAVLVAAKLLRWATKPFRRRLSGNWRVECAFEPLSNWDLMLLFVLLLGVWPISMQTITRYAYTFDCSLNKVALSRTSPDYLQVSVTLGGALSDPRAVRIVLQPRQGGGSRELHTMTAGISAFAIIPASQLDRGEYSVQVSYEMVFMEMGRKDLLFNARAKPVPVEQVFVVF